MASVQISLCTLVNNEAFCHAELFECDFAQKSSKTKERNKYLIVTAESSRKFLVDAPGH